MRDRSFSIAGFTPHVYASFRYSRVNSTQALPCERTPSWLEQHYQATRERIANLVKVAVDQLVKEKRSVTIETICQESQHLDPQRKGIFFDKEKEQKRT